MSGTAEAIKGRVKEAAGALTDDDKLRDAGKADQACGKVKEAESAQKAAEKAQETAAEAGKAAKAAKEKAAEVQADCPTKCA